MNTTSRVPVWGPRLAASAVAASLVSALLAGTAQANPNPDGSPGQTVGTGDLWITSSTTVAKGQKISFAGEGLSLNNGMAQKLSAKWDAFSSSQAYTGTGHTDGVAGTFQVQADGTVSGSLVVPEDLDDASVNGTSDGPHFVRLLGGAPATSVFSEDFTLAADATPAPVVQATAATTSSRGTNAVTVTVTGTGFAPGESVSVTRALADTGLQWTTGTGASAAKVDTIAADSSGNLSGKIVLGFGVLNAGEHQLVFTGSSAPERPATAQVTVANYATLANIALDSQGTLTVSNAMPGTTFDTLQVDPDPAVTGDEIQVLDAPAVADAAGVATATFTLPDSVALLGTKTFTVGQAKPVAATQTLQAKVSPSSALLNEDGYQISSTEAGRLEQGLYQSAYSARSKALFATSASVLATSTLYKLDPDTLEVLAEVVPAEETPGAKWAAYGVGVDDKNGTVWVTNTRQNTVAIYAQDDLRLLKQWDRGLLTHTRDVVADTERDVVYVSSASEGTSGQGAIGVFEADDLDGDGTKYEWIENIAVHDRTTYSPMSLELDTASGKLFSPSLTSNKVAVVDLATRAVNLLELPDLTVGGRGASGVAYDHETRNLFVASQNSDEVLVATANQGWTAATTVTEIATGAGALNVAFEPVNKLAYVANFSGSTVTVLNQQGVRVANLPIARANHVAEGPNGVVYAVDKASGNKLYRIQPKAAAASATVVGQAQVGQRLTASSGAAIPGADITRQWQADGRDIAGATEASYLVRPADLGKKLTVTLTVTAPGKASSSTTSAPTATVTAGTLVGGPVTVTGTAQVGRTLNVATGTWTQGTALRLQWRANGAPLAGATGRTLTLKPAHLGQRITVSVTGSLAGHTTRTVTSTATGAVRAAALKAGVVKIGGVARVGKKLTAKPGTWTAGTRLTYQWTANGKAVKGATKASFRLTSKVRGAKVAVKVTGTLAGHTRTTKVAKAVKVKG